MSIMGVTTQLNDASEGFSQINSRKRKNNENAIPLKNKFQNLKDDVEDNSPNSIDNTKDRKANTDGDPVTGDPKNKIHPFLIEVKSDWIKLAKEVQDLNEVKPLIKMDGAHLKVHCKNDNDFRKTQSYLDSNAIAYTTLSPQEKRPRKVCIRGIPVRTDPNIIINALKDHGFIANRAAMLKNRKTGNPMPIYLINVLPRSNFDEIYKITELCFLSVTVERFRGAGVVKQCYRCQGFGHASEICNFTPRCVKCAMNHLTSDCPSKDRIKPTCANCTGPHPASYRGCPRNPQNLKKTTNSQDTTNSSKPKPISKISSEVAQILKNYNYVKNPINSNNSNKPADASAQNPSSKEDATLPQTLNVSPDGSAATNTPSTNTTPEANNSNYTNDFSEVFKTFQEIKEILNLNKLLKCFKNIATLMKKCKNPLDKMFIIINEFDTLTSELSFTDDE